MEHVSGTISKTNIQVVSNDWIQNALFLYY